MWHDLCEDDLILPAHGNEYVLKGSELFEESNSGEKFNCFVDLEQRMFSQPLTAYEYMHETLIIMGFALQIV